MLELKEVVEKMEYAKEKRARAKGSLDREMDELENKFKIKSIEEAKKKLIELNKKMENDEKRLSSILKEINDSADWDAI